MDYYFVTIQQSTPQGNATGNLIIKDEHPALWAQRVGFENKRAVVITFYDKIQEHVALKFIGVAKAQTEQASRLIVPPGG